MSILKSKVFKWGLLSALIIMVTGSFVGYKMYTKPHRDVQHIKAMAVAATKLVADYEANEAHADSTYLDKVLEVAGEITEITKNQKGETVIALDGTGIGTVRCTLEDSVRHDIKTGVSVIIRGICTGYLTDVIMVRGLFQGK